MGERFMLSLVSMPWSLPHRPSIQTGLLAAVCAEASIPVRQWPFHVDWLEHMVSTLGREPKEVVDTYARIVDELVVDLAGEWIFAHLVNRAATPREYLGYLDERRVAPELREVVRTLARSSDRFIDECAERILASGTTMVGLTTSFCQTMPALALVKRLKERDAELVCVFGGANCDAGMGRRLQRAYPAIDFVVEGEGERALVELCRTVAEHGGHPGPVNIPGVFPSPSPVTKPALLPPDMSSVVPDYVPYFEKVDASPYAGLLRYHCEVPFEMSRGCWWGEKHHCTFCGLNGTGMPFRAKAESFLATQLDELATRHGVTSFTAVDNIIDMNLLRNGLPGLSAGGRDYSLFFEVKANLRRDQLELARSAGVRSVQPGIESLDSGILKDIDIRAHDRLQHPRLWTRGCDHRNGNHQACHPTGRSEAKPHWYCNPMSHLRRYVASVTDSARLRWVPSVRGFGRCRCRDHCCWV
jgi:ribosomal peptide maturation radical SAM protein 1